MFVELHGYGTKRIFNFDWMTMRNEMLQLGQCRQTGQRATLCSGVVNYKQSDVASLCCSVSQIDVICAQLLLTN
jgi:hypothetical protein